MAGDNAASDRGRYRRVAEYDRRVRFVFALGVFSSPRKPHEMPDQSGDAHMVAVADMRLRGGWLIGRLIGKRRAARPDCLELRFLFVAQLCIEVVQGGANGLDRLQ